MKACCVESGSSSSARTSPSAQRHCGRCLARFFAQTLGKCREFDRHEPLVSDFRTDAPSRKTSAARRMRSGSGSEASS